LTTDNTSRKVLILVNHDIVLYNFRKELVERLLLYGYQVIVSSPYGERIDDLVAMGCEYEEVVIKCHSINPFNDLLLYFSYKKLIKRIKPDIVLTYGNNGVGY